MNAAALVRKLCRYAAVSVVTTATSMLVLGVLVATRAMTAGWANVVATAAGTFPSFELNRRWVWGKRNRRSVRTEIGPFVALSFAGLAISTAAVSLAAGWATHAGMSTTARTLAAEAASVASFGSLWVLQFVVLDRVLFARRLPVAA